MASPSNNRLRPTVTKAIAQSNNPEAKKSLAYIQILLLNKRLAQLEVDRRNAEKDIVRVTELRNQLLDSFPEMEDL
jgi:hypothetical protein